MTSETPSIEDLVARAAAKAMQAKAVEAVLHQKAVYAYEPTWTHQSEETRAEVVKVLDRLVEIIASLEVE